MLLRSSGPLADSLHLLTLGASCYYLLGTPRDSAAAVFDCGSSAHVGGLVERLKSFQFDPQQLQRLFITSINPERIGGLPNLRKLLPHLTVAAPPSTAVLLEKAETRDSIYREDLLLSAEYGHDCALERQEYEALLHVDQVFDSSTVPLSIHHHKLTAVPGGTGSCSYLIHPLHYLIAEESVGFFRGRELAAPGFGTSEQRIASVRALGLKGICFPFVGAIMGESVEKYLESIEQNISDIRNEVKEAISRGAPSEVMREALRQSFFTPSESDPALRAALRRAENHLLNALFPENP